MQSLMCQSWTGHQGVNTWNMEYEKWKMKENNYFINYLNKTIWRGTTEPFILMICVIDSDLLYVQCFSDYMINVSATYIINVCVNNLKIETYWFKLKDECCLPTFKLNPDHEMDVHLSDNNLYKVGIPAQRVLRSLRPQ